MKVGIIILCRYDSSRLPGKILKEINGKPILLYIIERLSCVVSTNSIVVATSEENSDDPIVEFCRKSGIQVFRGSLLDVASRFLTCAKKFNFDFAFRINGDNLFVDIDLIRSALSIAHTGEYSFISNVHNRTFPKGMSIEGVNVELYASEYPKFNIYQREHVMPYFYDNGDRIRHFYIYNVAVPELAGVQLAIDTETDYDFAKKIVSKFKIAQSNYGLKEIATIIKSINEK